MENYGDNVVSEALTQIGLVTVKIVKDTNCCGYWKWESSRHGVKRMTKAVVGVLGCWGKEGVGWVGS